MGDGVGALRLPACRGGEGVTELLTCFFCFGLVLVLLLVLVASCYVASSSSWLHGGGWLWRGDGVLFVWFADRDRAFLVKLCWWLDDARFFLKGALSGGYLRLVPHHARIFGW
jgi:hypothetical protein